MLLNDQQISDLARRYGMIKPFVAENVRQVQNTASPGTNQVISYGLGSYGYDIRLSPKEFAVFKRTPGQIVDPKAFIPENLEPVKLNSDWYGDYFIIPGNSYGLGVALEYINLPSDVLVLCLGKSTYARAGLIANVTPAEPGWKGHLTLEFSNSSPSDCKIYAGEGIIQLLFAQGEPCMFPYNNRKSGGKYQNQGEQITHSRV